MYYLNNFFFFSIIGFIMETIINLSLNQSLDSGFLKLPYTPIYGLGILIIIIINKLLDKYHLNKHIKLIITFLLNTTILTLIEYIGGITLKAVLHKSFWDYCGLPLSIGKYISLEISLLWGLLSLIYLYLVKKHIDKFVNKIPKFITYINIILISIDLLYIIIKIN